jgi:hypothetical protein
MGHIVVYFTNGKLKDCIAVGAVAVARKPMKKSGFLVDVAGSSAAELGETF